ncbi:hypothetical protein Gotur_015243 [Gossypium turneri]
MDRVRVCNTSGAANRELLFGAANRVPLFGAANSVPSTQGVGLSKFSHVCRSLVMAGSGSSMLYSFLLFTVILSLQEMYRGKLASSELFTILGGFISSLLFLVLLTYSKLILIPIAVMFFGFYEWESSFILAEAVSLIAASTVHRVCITTW